MWKDKTDEGFPSNVPGRIYNGTSHILKGISSRSIVSLFKVPLKLQGKGGMRESRLTLVLALPGKESNSAKFKW